MGLLAIAGLLVGGINLKELGVRDDEMFEILHGNFKPIFTEKRASVDMN